MNSEALGIVVCGLPGYEKSNPEIVISYPPESKYTKKSEKLLSKCLPMGAKPGNFIINKYEKCNLLSFVFKIVNKENRDDLLSFSLLLNKKVDTEIYKEIIQQIIDDLEKNGLLKEEILRKNHDTIYDGINEEKDIKIEDLEINLSDYFKEIKAKLKKDKINLKGSFF